MEHKKIHHTGDTVNELTKTLFTDRLQNQILTFLLSILFAVVLAIIAASVIGVGQKGFVVITMILICVMAGAWNKSGVEVKIYRGYPILFLGKRTNRVITAGFWREIYPFFTFARNEEINFEKQILKVENVTNVDKAGQEVRIDKIILDYIIKPNEAYMFTNADLSAFKESVETELRQAGENVEAQSEFGDTTSLLRSGGNGIASYILENTPPLKKLADDFHIQILNLACDNPSLVRTEDVNALAAETRAEQENKARQKKVAQIDEMIINKIQRYKDKGIEVSYDQARKEVMNTLGTIDIKIYEGLEGTKPIISLHD